MGRQDPGAVGFLTEDEVGSRGQQRGGGRRGHLVSKPLTSVVTGP